jgi:hypothetical protein
MRVSIPASKQAISAVSVELRALGASFDKLSKLWRIDQHLVYDALAIIEKGANATLRAVISAERGDVAQAQALSANEVYALGVYCSENGIPHGVALQAWQVQEALRIHA